MPQLLAWQTQFTNQSKVFDLLRLFVVVVEKKMEKQFFQQHQRHLSAYGQTNVCPSFACAVQDLSRYRYLFGSTYNEVAEFGI